MRGAGPLILSVTVTVLALMTQQRHLLTEAVLVLRDNGYEGVTVAIHRNVPEDPRIIDNIKSLMTSASRVLYSATQRRAFFRHVTIVVPASWSRVGEMGGGGGGGGGGTAQVRVDRANPAYGNNPYTEQAGGCGEPGTFIHLTGDFISELHGETSEEYGDPGKTFVHEWAHLRYGVFDEYGDWGDSRTPPFYLDDTGQVRVTGCAANDTRSPREGTTCTNPEDCVLDIDFNEEEEEEEETGKSSLMYLHFLPGADGFCGSEQSRSHNADAPNRQNLMCQGRSSWEVISAHPDFADGNNPSGPSDADTVPIFHIVQPRNDERGTFVLLLDVSGSMTGPRMAMLHRAASRFVLDQIPERARLGVVAFSSEVRVLLNVSRVTDGGRERMVRALPTTDDGGRTAIGMALRTALQILNMTSGNGGVVILISDGEENVSPYVRSVVPDVVGAGVVVNAVAFGRSASAQLESVVRATGGRGFFYPDNEDGQVGAGTSGTDHGAETGSGNQRLESAFLAAMSTQADVDFVPVEILNMLEIVNPGETKSNFVYIDAEVRKNSKFLFGYTDGSNLAVEVISPSGRIHDNTSAEFENDSIGKVVRFAFPETEVGKWTYRLMNGHGGLKQGIGVMVTSEVVDAREQPVRVESWINANTVDFPKDVMRSKVFAKVTKSYVAVLNALVIAEVERPLGAAVKLLLKDDGSGADVAASDGIYSAYFSQFNGSGRYAVAVSVANDGRAALKLAKEEADGGDMHLWPVPPAAAMSRTVYRRHLLAASNGAMDSARLSGMTMAAFQRNANAGSFKVEGWLKDEDFVPPGRVLDLQVAASSLQRDDQLLVILALSWTSAGDDFDSGRAERWNVYVRESAALLRRDYLAGQHLDSNATLTAGSSRPAPSGEKQNVQLSLIGTHFRHHIVYVAVQLCDERNNCADMSNIVVVNTNDDGHQFDVVKKIMIGIGIIALVLALINYRMLTALVEQKRRVI